MNNYNYLKKYRKLCYQDRLYIYEREKSRVAMQNLPWQEYEVDMANMVETNIGLMPEEDCNEIWALQCGFDSYEDMQEQLRKGNI